MENIVLNRLQLVKHEEIFATREDAINYVLNIQNFERPSLVAEPMILLYESGSAVKGPNVILAVGSVGDGATSSNNNRTFFIDTQKTEEEIEELRELIEQAIASLTLKPIDSDTIDLSVEKTDNGTFLSGDVKIADYRIIDEKIVNNIIETEGNKGIYTFVDMEYDPRTFVITFRTTKTTKEFQLPPDQHLVKGWYDPREESIFFKLADDSQVKVPVTKLIEEWTVLPDSDTPVLLFKEHVSAITEGHEGIYDWQDVLTADVRVADHIDDNIIHKDRTGRFLYVKGTADNIKYKNGQTVADALDNIDTKVSTSAGNIIYKRPDGIYAYAMLDYKQAENKIVYKYTNGSTGELNTVEFQLNSVKLLEDITYDPVKEVIVIRYIDAQGEYQRVEIPVADIIEEWDVLNEGHNIQLNKFRSEGQGKDILTADAKIYQGYNNILEDKNHELYVNGIAENIKYDVTGDTTVKEVLDELKAEDEDLDNKIDEEIARAKAAEQALDSKIDQEIEDRIADVDEEQARAEAAEEVLTNKIGTGFTDDPHENVTAKFEELSGKTDDEIARATAKDAELEETINNEIARSTEKDAELEAAIAAETARATAAEDALQDEIDAVSADSASSLKSISNVDKSINVDNTDAVNPVIKVNISGHENNTIRLIQQEGIEGLFNFVDLTYDADHNTLTFTRSTDGASDYTREIQLQSVSFIDEIYYDKNTEELVIVYYSGHDRKEMRIPLRDLIDEWDVYNDVHSAVVLTKEWNADLGKNILSAEVRISSKDDNILENQEGELYVSNSAITANAEAISELDEKIDAETQRAENSENALSGAINNEVIRATVAEDTLQGAIDNEIARATASENELQDAIDNEVERATAAEEVLTDTIGTGFTENPYENVTYRFNQLSGKVDTEIADRIAEANAEQARAEAAEAALQNAIDAEQARAEAAEDILQTSINNEATRATGAESALRQDLTDEITRATNSESELQSNIDDENIRAISAETALQTAIVTEATRATTAESNLQHLIEDEAATRLQNDTILQTNINTEVARATGTENRLETAINNEISRAQTKEGELNSAIVAETLRAQEADNELYHDLSDETAARAAADADLLSQLNQEVSRATVQENVLSGKIDSEIARSTAKDDELSAALQQEITNRQQGDAELAEAIQAATLTFDDTSSIDFTKTTGNVVTADVKLQEGDNIIKLGQGLYASVHLSYDPGTNKIKLITSNGTDEEIQLVGASLLEDLHYDATNKALVITYKDATGIEHTVQFGVSELFNEWHIENPSEKSAVELTKTPAAEPGGEDVLSARVLITDDTNGDGKPDEGSNNIIEIKNNGLYVDGSAMEDAKEIAECVQNEIKVLEKAVIGHQIGEECGSGYTYEASQQANYINSAISFYNADIILDMNLKKVENDVEEIKEDVACIDGKAESLYKMLYTNAAPIPACGSGATYQPYQGACIISGATSFMEADQLLNDQICEILNMWVSGKTCTTESEWVDEGANKKMLVDVRLSRGNNSEMSDEDIVIETLSGDYIDPTRTEFTDTNALRIVCLTEGPSGTTPSVDSMQNGVYLSNVWDCGLYYDEVEDADAIAAASAAGYKTDNYRTDLSPDASNYNYMNNVRQSDIPHT